MIIYIYIYIYIKILGYLMDGTHTKFLRKTHALPSFSENDSLSCRSKESIQAIINESINALTVMLKKTSETNLTGAV